MPIIPFTPKNYVKQEKEKKTENKNEKKIDKKNLENSKDIKNKMHTVFLQLPFFTNPINKVQKNIYDNKFQYRKIKPFRERTGDWICKNCRNLNFAFRVECNRCKLPKKDVMPVQKSGEIINENKNKILENNFSLNSYVNAKNNILNSYKNSNQNNLNYKYKYYYQNNNIIYNKTLNNKECSSNKNDK